MLGPQGLGECQMVLPCEREECDAAPRVTIDVIRKLPSCFVPTPIEAEGKTHKVWTGEGLLRKMEHIGTHQTTRCREVAITALEAL